MSFITLIIAFLVSFGAMFLGAVSGGVGLILRPALVFLGFPALSVIGSVRVAAIFGDLPSLLIFHKKKKIDWKLVFILIIPVILGGVIAGMFALSLPEGLLNKVIGFFLFLAGIVLIIKRKVGLEEIHVKRKSKHLVGIIGATILSFFNTLIGGMGVLFNSLYIFNYGKSYISASALRRGVNYFGLGLVSILFIAGKIINWQLVIAVGLGLTLGSYFGTHFNIKKGEKWVRNLILIIIFVSAIKLIFF